MSRSSPPTGSTSARSDSKRIWRRPRFLPLRSTAASDRSPLMSRLHPGQALSRGVCQTATGGPTQFALKLARPLADIQSLELSEVAGAYHIRINFEQETVDVDDDEDGTDGTGMGTTAALPLFWDGLCVTGHARQRLVETIRYLWRQLMRVDLPVGALGAASLERL